MNSATSARIAPSRLTGVWMAPLGREYLSPASPETPPASTEEFTAAVLARLGQELK